jgi:two-component system CheB/CheR fusion protein
MDETQGPDFSGAGATEQVGAMGAATPVVGIGASAGGLEVFKYVLALMPGDTGFAIVFVQHLDPNHHSMLAEILTRATAMAVLEAADACRWKPTTYTS